MLELLRLHLLELFGILGPEAGRVEVEVARNVPGTELEIVLRHGRLHPAAEGAEAQDIEGRLGVQDVVVVQLAAAAASDSVSVSSTSTRSKSSSACSVFLRY